MRLYITRHGETLWNIQNRMQGWKNSHLSEKGIADAKRLGRRIQDVALDCIYTSPLGRAVETAELIRGEREIPIVQVDGLKEMHFGAWEGLPYDEINERYAEENLNFWHRPTRYQAVGGESYQDLIRRVSHTLAEIVARHPEGNVLIVTHGVTKKAIYKIIKQIPLEEFWGPPRMENTSLSIVEVAEDRMVFVLEADVSHLKE